MLGQNGKPMIPVISTTRSAAASFKTWLILIFIHSVLVLQTQSFKFAGRYGTKFEDTRYFQHHRRIRLFVFFLGAMGNRRRTSNWHTVCFRWPFIYCLGTWPIENIFSWCTSSKLRCYIEYKELRRVLFLTMSTGHPKVHVYVIQ